MARSSRQRSITSRRRLQSSQTRSTVKRDKDKTEQVWKSKPSDTKPAEFIANLNQTTAIAGPACLYGTRELMTRRPRDQQLFLLLLTRTDVDRPNRSEDVCVNRSQATRRVHPASCFRTVSLPAVPIAAPYEGSAPELGSLLFVSRRTQRTSAHEEGPACKWGQSRSRWTITGQNGCNAQTITGWMGEGD
jgi:hypothetical protein